MLDHHSYGDDVHEVGLIEGEPCFGVFRVFLEYLKASVCEVAELGIHSEIRSPVKIRGHVRSGHCRFVVVVVGIVVVVVVCREEEGGGLLMVEEELSRESGAVLPILYTSLSRVSANQIGVCSKADN